VQSNIYFPKEVRQSLATFNHGKPLVHVNALLGFDNMIDMHVFSPKITLADQGFQWHWSGVQGEVHVKSDFTSLKSHFVMPLFSVTGKNGQSVVIKDVEKQTDVKQVKPYIWVGNASLTVAKVQVMEKNKLQLLAEKGLIAYTANLKGNNYSVLIKTALKNLNTQGYSVGPVHMDYSFNNLNADAVVNLQKMIINFQSQPTGGAQVLGLQALGLLPQLLQKDTSISIDRLNVLTRQGLLSFDGKIYWPSVKKISSAMSILEAAYGKANMKLPVKLFNYAVNYSEKEQRKYEKAGRAYDKRHDKAHSTPIRGKQKPIATTAGEIAHNMMQAWVKQGYVKQENGFYVTHVSSKGMLLMANGHQVFPPVSPAPTLKMPKVSYSPSVAPSKMQQKADALKSPSQADSKPAA
jgi:uncharacterized protein YdgA (DUF945 family)